MAQDDAEEPPQDKAPVKERWHGWQRAQIAQFEAVEAVEAVHSFENMFLQHFETVCEISVESVHSLCLRALSALRFDESGHWEMHQCADHRSPQTASALCPGDRVIWYKEKGDRSQWTRGETIQGGQLVIFSDGNVTACYYSCINYITYRTVDTCTHRDTDTHTRRHMYACLNMHIMIHRIHCQRKLGSNLPSYR